MREKTRNLYSKSTETEKKIIGNPDTVENKSDSVPLIGTLLEKTRS